MKSGLIPIAFTVFILFACNGRWDNANNTLTTIKPSSIISYVLINTYPHDTTSFTEGFLIHEGKLYESTGATQDLPQTKSLFGVVDITTGKISTKVELDRVKYFGEGITFLNGKVYQLTYKTKIGFVYDAKSFKKIREFTFQSKEGWGLTTNGEVLIMSDGTNILTLLDPITFEVIKTIAVIENRYAKYYLNELEYIKGFVYANIWTTNTIVKIDLSDGNVIGKLDLTALSEQSKYSFSGSLEMNGIAYDSTTNRVFVTGKLWPIIYELKIEE